MTEYSSAEITVNGQARACADEHTVADLVGNITGRVISAKGTATDGTSLGVAVAQNGEVVPRSQWARTLLGAGDDIEILTAVQGG